MTFVDTSALYALIVPEDSQHEQARTLLRRHRSDLITSDFVLFETVTLLKSRGQRGELLRWAPRLRVGELATVEAVQAADIERAWSLFLDYRDKNWSFVDCTSFALIERLDVQTAFAFDHHFRQFGQVEVVP